MTGLVHLDAILDDCSDLSSWTISNTNANRTATEDVVLVKNGDKSLHMACTASAVATMTLTKNIDHSFKQDDRLAVSAYIPFDPAGTTVGFSLFASTAQNFGAGDKYVARMDANLHHGERVGWGLYMFSFDDTAVNSGSPAIDLDYQSIRLGLTAHASYAREIYIDAVMRYRARPTIILQFDDGRDSSYTEGFSYAQTNGIPATHYLIASRLDTSTFLTTAQAREMLAAGDEIGAHGDGTSGVDSWGDTPSSIVTDTDAIDQVMGIKTRTGAYPQGDYGVATGGTDAVFEKCEEAGLTTCRTTVQGMLYNGYYSPYTLPREVALGNATTLTEAKAQVDRAIKYGGTCVISGHKLEATAADASTWAIADYQALMDYIVLKRKQGLVDCKTIAQWLAG